MCLDHNSQWLAFDLTASGLQYDGWVVPQTFTYVEPSVPHALGSNAWQLQSVYYCCEVPEYAQGSCPKYFCWIPLYIESFCLFLGILHRLSST